MTFAIVLSSQLDLVEGILMILDERDEAEDVAFELRLRGQDVEVVEVGARLHRRVVPAG